MSLPIVVALALSACVGAQAQPAAPLPHVLYVQDQPTWEYRYLSHALVRRADLVVQCYLVAASADFVQAASSGEPALTSLPTDDDRLAGYDLILVGGAAPDAFVSALERHVARGGKVMFVDGGVGLRQRVDGTLLPHLLPIAEGGATVAPASAPARLAVDADHTLADTATAPSWPDLRVPVDLDPQAELRPRAQVTVGTESDRGEATSPLVVSRSHHQGRTILVATSETWRWRQGPDAADYERFWRAVLAWALASD